MSYILTTLESDEQQACQIPPSQQMMWPEQLIIICLFTRLVAVQLWMLSDDLFVKRLWTQCQNPDGTSLEYLLHIYNPLHGPADKTVPENVSFAT